VAGIVAPASAIQAPMFEAGIRELQSLGLETRHQPGILEVTRYTAGSVERRLTEFEAMLSDPGIDAIFPARGGYGSRHLLPHLDLSRLVSNPKVVCGSSDITSLLTAAGRAGVVTFHGPMVATSIRRGREGYDRDLFRRVLFEGEAVDYDMTGVSGLRKGTARGWIRGGCLALLAASIGTPWEISARGAILIVEDINCRPYQIDGMLTHLHQAGALEGVRGFVFGEMPGCLQHPEQGYTLEEVILDVLAAYDVPIVFGFPTGHSEKPNVIVPLGVRAELAVGSDLSFRLLEPAVDAGP
jgi:muramoyltetrapeptide carboxypeptidase